MTAKRFIYYNFLLWMLLTSLIGCSMPQSNGGVTTTTLNVTQAYQTVDARLTQALLSTPSVTLQPTETQIDSPSPTLLMPTATLASAATGLSASPTGNCNLAAPGTPIDVTIPDNAQMYPGSTFVKIWRLQNIGTCTWKGYVAAYFSGELMGAPASVPLANEVAPGQSVDISVDMVAPKTPGIYQGNWKLRTDSGAWFGIGPQGNAPFWVRIEVIAVPTETAFTPTPEGTLAPTITVGVTTTPVIQARGTVIIPVDSLLDLDTIRLNNGGEDLSYAQNSEGKPVLTPVDNAVIGVFGADQPSYRDCSTGTFSSDPILVDNLSPGTYLCYRTNMGRTGRALLLNINPENLAITLDILTWDIQ